MLYRNFRYDESGKGAKIMLWAILPVKSYRTVGTVSSTGSLEETLSFLKTVSNITTIIVMSPDAKAVAVARSFGVRTISIADLPAWTTGLSRALHLAAAAGVLRAMVLNPAFLCLDSHFFNQLLATEQPAGSLSLVPLGETDDTGIALVSPPNYLQISLGSGSLQRNIKAARLTHAPLTIYSLDDLSMAPQ